MKFDSPSTLRILQPAVVLKRMFPPVTLVLLLPLQQAQACSLTFTSPVRGSTVFSSGVTVSGVGSGTADQGAVGQVVATINGQVFFQQSGTFTTLINFFGSGAASVSLKRGANYLDVSGSVEGCSASDGMVIYYEPDLDTPLKNQGQPDVCVGNPVNPLTGNKYQQEVLAAARPSLGLPAIGHSYNSDAAEVDLGLGYGWSADILKKIVTDGQSMLVKDGSGKSEPFTASGSEWQGDPDSRIAVETSVNGFTLSRLGASVEEYSTLGQLVALRQQGVESRYVYGEQGVVSTISGPGGVAIQLAYTDDGHLGSITEPGGLRYDYHYDEIGNLASVSMHPVDPEEAVTSRIYHYEDPAFPHHLTGITDEEGQRFATWSYDSSGRAVSSEHANGIELSTIDYSRATDLSAPRVTITNTLGKQTTYHFTTLHGVAKVTQVEGHATASCVASNQYYTYDLNGNPDLVTDWKGMVTDYDYDAHGLETRRIEAAGTADERIITTEWDMDLRLPLTVTSPESRVIYQYDAEGRLLLRHASAAP